MWFMAAGLTWQRHRRTYRRFHPAILCILLLGGMARGNDAAPPAPDRPWAPPGLGEYESALARTNAAAAQSPTVTIDPQKIYDLPELIDLAERSHPETRVAWERARQAARAVGLNESAYYPYLAASASGAYAHELGTLTSVFPVNAAEEDAGLDLKWLLFDFGGRHATLDATRAQLMAANVGFNATHQQIVFAVTKSFYGFNTAREQVGVAESALSAAQTVEAATAARFTNGLAILPNLLQAQQQTAQAAYELDAARGNLSDAQIALVDSLGIFPYANLQVAEIPDKHFDENLDEPLEKLVDRALAQRPDLVGSLAKLRAWQAEVREAHAAYYPKVSLEASGGWSKLDLNVYGSPWFGNSKPAYGVGLAVDLPLFDGFLRRNKLRVAESQLRAAESELANSRDTAVREVWKAYTDLETALRKQESAGKLLAAAQSAFDASLEAYRHGLGTYVDTANAQRDVTTARSLVVDTRSDILTGTAALALSVGDLARPAPAPTPRSQP
jgi:outer membrane protein TolC